ncbi:hypothetical protein BKP37_05415 [Anaerobacillus alkalilacustris]|uniref:Helix-hairpin-helix DNA-binding motif class 1 domain-containing protein n=2 Tax=Anaerobacillus alkalilacustris TaxID=393763 RepID=A0A1S2LVV2_9BACI|nr:hypothetical protein BKP37_05415 [Anaerobacillus alkalilacustris]
MIKLRRNSAFLLIVFSIALFFSVSFIRNFDNSRVSEGSFENFIEYQGFEMEVEKQEEEIRTIIVDVKGAVNQPNVYEMYPGDRVINVIEKAEGFHSEANVNLINLAQLLVDEMVIYVPFIGEEGELSLVSTLDTTNSTNGKINLNYATSEELQAIPGIGPSKASAIISYREEFGKFNTVDELINVSGIGQKSLEKMIDFIEVK